MASNDNTFITTLDVLNALQTFIAALEFSPGMKLFDEVEPYPSPDLLQALDDLRKFKSRVCIIVPSADRFEHHREGSQSETKCFRSFILLMAEQEFATTQKAMLGSNNALGLMSIKDSLETNLSNQNLNFAPRILDLHPLDGSPVKTIKAGEARGRLGWQMTIEIEAGHRLFNVR